MTRLIGRPRRLEAAEAERIRTQSRQYQFRAEVLNLVNQCAECGVVASGHTMATHHHQWRMKTRAQIVADVAALAANEGGSW